MVAHDPPSARSRLTLVVVAALVAVVTLGLSSYLVVRVPVVVVLRGSDSLGSTLIPELAKRFLETRGVQDPTVEFSDSLITVEGTPSPDGQPIRFEIHSTDTKDAFDPTKTDTDIGMASRKIRVSEADLLRPSRGDVTSRDVEYLVARDGVTVVVNQDVDLSSLTMVQLQAIFSCGTTDWGSLNARPGPIRLFVREQGSGTRDEFESRVMKEKVICDSDGQSTEETSSSDLMDKVGRTPGAIGFVASATAVIGTARTLAIVSEGGAAIRPTPYPISTEDYPLFRRLYLYLYGPAPNPLARAFVDFVRSEERRPDIKGAGFVPPGFNSERCEEPRDDCPKVAPAAPPPASPAASPESVAAPPALKPSIPTCLNPPTGYLELVSGAERQSTVIRFRINSDEIDNDGVLRIGELARGLGQGPRRTVLLAGFASSPGAPGYNLDLSKRRARAVADELRRQEITAVDSEGYGEECPLGVEDPELGAEGDRRVEIWLK